MDGGKETKNKTGKTKGPDFGALSRKGEQMLRKFYETVLDVELYRQMVDLIYRLSDKKDKETFYSRMQGRTLFLDYPDEEMETAYGFHYPGEVLERLDEKETVTKRQLRSLGLALAETKALQNDGMFIGKQNPSFWKRLKRTLKPTDLFWMGIQYLMEDGNQKEWYGKLLDFPVQSIEEMVFILYVLPDEQAVWESLKGRLDRLLGKERNFSVYTHTEMYVWLTTHCSFRISGYRKKDIETLKYLMRLPCSYAKEGSIARKKLLEAGYSAQEIMYLSMSLLYQVRGCELLKKNGLTAERMAVETCMLFLSGEEGFPEQAGELCRQILNDYRHFDIRLEDTTGIFERLYELLTVENVKTYELLLLNDSREEQHCDWYWIDLMDSKWQGLYSLIERERFDKWVFGTLRVKAYKKEETGQYLRVYQDLTGEDFFQHFWSRENRNLRDLFHRWSGWGLIDPLQLLEAYLEESQSDHEQADQKWVFMKVYLKSYMSGLKTPESVEMLFRLEEWSTLSGQEPFPIKELLLDSVGIKDEYRRLSFDRLDFIRPFLDIEGHCRIFCLVEQHLLKNHPKEYIPFLMKVLSMEENFLWFPKEEARNIFYKLTEISGDQRELDGLRKIYLTEEDFEAVQAERKEKEKRRLLFQQMNKIRSIHKDFSLYVAKARKTGKQFEELWNYLDWHRFDREYKKERRYITKRYLCGLFRKEPRIVLEHGEAVNFCRLLLLLFEKAEMTLPEMKDLMDHIEMEKEEA